MAVRALEHVGEQERTGPLQGLPDQRRNDRPHPDLRDSERPDGQYPERHREQHDVDRDRRHPVRMVVGAVSAAAVSGPVSPR
ncbi:hypothetical protein ACFFWA_37845 [Actinomadura verrucosospora]|uniref:hypothetical protein n=1 Tax=Actinomadura verrucosospora TaxID=46165 RepID=UPI0031E9A3BD